MASREQRQPALVYLDDGLGSSDRASWKCPSLQRAAFSMSSRG